MSDSGKVLIYVNIPELFIRVYPFVFYFVPLAASCQYPEAAVGRSTGSSAILTPLLRTPRPVPSQGLSSSQVLTISCLGIRLSFLCTLNYLGCLQ